GAPNRHYFVAYGDFQPPFDLPVAKDDCSRPEGLEPVLVQSGEPHLEEWRVDAYLGRELKKHPDGIDAPVRAATRAIVLQRELEDMPDLFALRSTLSVLTSAFGWGAAAIVDPLAGRWWSRKEWVAAFVEEKTFQPLAH